MTGHKHTGTCEDHGQDQRHTPGTCATYCTTCGCKIRWSTGQWVRILPQAPMGWQS